MITTQMNTGTQHWITCLMGLRQIILKLLQTQLSLVSRCYKVTEQGSLHCQAIGSGHKSAEGQWPYRGAGVWVRRSNFVSVETVAKQRTEASLDGKGQRSDCGGSADQSAQKEERGKQMCAVNVLLMLSRIEL